MNSVDFNFFYPQVKYSGGACDDANIGYFIGFSVVFFFVSAVSATQLVCNKYCTNNTVENLVVVLVNPFAPKMSLVILLTVCYSILINCICKFGEFGIG